MWAHPQATQGVGLISLPRIRKTKNRAGNHLVGPDTFSVTMLTDRTNPAGFLLPKSEQYLKKFSKKIILYSYEQRLLKRF
jgi:hypothetical protein